MAMTDHKITENMMENKRVTDAPDQPQGTAQQNKYLFDRLAKEVIIPAFNALIDSLTSAGGADIGVSVPGVSGTTVKEVLSSMKTLIDDRYTKSQSDANLKNKTDPLIKSVKLDPQTGIWTFTKENGQTVTVDTNLEKIALDAKLDSETKEFVLTLADGTEQRVSLSSFVRFLEFVGSDEIEFSTTGNTVKAGIKSGSIAEDKLNPALFSRLDTAVSTAESSAANAQTYAQKAQTQATNAAGSAVDAGIDAHNAETWTEGGQLMGEGGTLLPEHTTGAKEYAQMAQNSAGQAASSAANADTSKNAAAESAAAAARSAEEAASAAGGGVTSFNGRGGAVKPQEGDYTAEMVGAIDQNEKGRASGVASLDADGKVIADQLPEMNYDPAGSAQAVQQELNTHAANNTLHVTDEERQAWNNKAPGTHTHTAAQVGALPISGGTMTGALNMNGKALTNLPTPKNNRDAVPKDYVDAAVITKRGWTELTRITSSTKWSVPSGVTRIGVFILGAGASGEGGEINPSGGAYGSAAVRGGPSGWGLSVILNVTPGQSFDVVIGAGGVPTGTIFSPGGDTKFGAYTALGGGKLSRGLYGGQDVSNLSHYVMLNVMETAAPYGGVSATIPFFDTYSTTTYYTSWASVLTPNERNIFDPNMKVFGLGGCVVGDTSRNIKIFAPSDLGNMGKGGEVTVVERPEYHVKYKGGNATGYGNGGGACLLKDDVNADALGGNGSPGIVIIYV
ncbi:hypothetical protein B5F17_01805 [Butyricicoccus pullicaecorum]|uniref:Glycine-rich domain-containing protein n=1 Tax=Butyricicoccus pullicaecorum TaxID=501571 RepID=A0A1Y4LDK3_9FIRM|nr:hypothetical protein [Butyricicoccus pullicaecorum]OUP53970.1 hypothetical protein B5F17_01805 [Butyricicoccus pullicaecorum]